MEARAKKVGVPKTLKYLFPQNGGVNSSDAPKAKALGLPGVALAVAHKILTAVKGLWIRSSPWLMLVRHRVR